MEQGIYSHIKPDKHNNPMIARYHYWEIKFSEKVWLLNVREHIDGTYWLYAISEK